MLFLGIDLGWVNGASGVAELRFVDRRLVLADLRLAARHDDVVAWVDRQAGTGPAILGVDAPTIIPNATGQRRGERELNAAFRKHLLNCHPANLGRPFAALTTRLAQRFEERGFRHADRIEAGKPGRYQIEVFPHAAIVRLFGLKHRIPYKRGAVKDRVTELKRLRELMFTLRDADPPLDLPVLPEVPNGGQARKDVEDQLDAILCAYTAAHYWFWGGARNQVFGTAETGFLVVPGTEAGTGKP